MRTTAHRSHRTRRTLATAAVLGLVSVTAAACGEEDFGTEEVGTETYAEVEEATEVTTDSIVGLEVTAVGNVSEVLSEEAVRIDRDGLGSFEDESDLEDAELYEYDYDYYDYDYLTAYDDDFGDTDLDEGVLVVGAIDGLGEQSLEDQVRVSGTVRQHDQDVLEEVYDLDLEGDELDDAGEVLVIVADSIAPAEETPDGTNDPATAEGGTSDGASEEASNGASDGASDGAGQDATDDATEQPTEEDQES